MATRALLATGGLIGALLLGGCFSGAGASSAADSMSVGSWVTANFIPRSHQQTVKRTTSDRRVQHRPAPRVRR